MINPLIALTMLLIGIQIGRKSCQNTIRKRLETQIMPYDVRETLRDAYFDLGGERKQNRKKIGLFR